MDAGTVEILVYDGVDELDALGPHEVFASAADRGGPAPTVRTLAPADTVTTGQGLALCADGVLSRRPDLLVVPGGGYNDRAEAGAWAEVERGEVPEAVAARYDRGTVVTSVCTGAMLLAAAGLLDGRPATTHGGARDDLRDAGAEVVDARVVDDGDVVTAGGVTAGIDLALHLVARLCGEEVAADVAVGLEYERQGRVHRA